MWCATIATRDGFRFLPWVDYSERFPIQPCLEMIKKNILFLILPGIFCHWVGGKLPKRHRDIK